MLAALRKSNPVTATAARKQDAVNEARAKVAELEGEVKRLRAEKAEHDREVERAQEGAKKASTTGHTVVLASYPSIAEARERYLRGQKLAADLGAASRRLDLAERRLEEAEKRARPLSPRALNRLEELVEAIEADQELMAAGINIPEMMATPSGPAHLLELAAEYGIGGGS